MRKLPALRSSVKSASNRGSHELHERIVKEILVKLGRDAHAVCRAWANPTGVAHRDRPWGKEFIQYGVKGSGDIYGFIIGSGRLFYLEVKSGNAKQQPNQEFFEAMCKRSGVLYFVCRSSEEALNYILRVAAS